MGEKYYSLVWYILNHFIQLSVEVFSTTVLTGHSKESKEMLKQSEKSGNRLLSFPTLL